MSQCITSRSALIGEVMKPGKVLVTIMANDKPRRIAVEKADLLKLLENEPDDDCSVMGYRRADGALVIEGREGE